MIKGEKQWKVRFEEWFFFFIWKGVPSLEKLGSWKHEILNRIKAAKEGLFSLSMNTGFKRHSAKLKDNILYNKLSIF